MEVDGTSDAADTANEAADLAAQPAKLLSFDDVLNDVSAKQKEAPAGGDADEDLEVDNKDDSDKDDADDDAEADKAKDKEPADDKKDDDPDPDAKKAEKDKADEDADDKDAKKDKKPDRASHHSEFKAKAEQFDALEKEFESVGGVEGLKDFASLVTAYRDPERVEEFIGMIGDLPAAHKGAIVSKLFYDALDMPENRVAAINDALLEVAETTSIKIGEGDLLKSPEELDKIIKYVAYLLEDDRDDLFETIDDKLAKIENLTPRERKLQDELRAKEAETKKGDKKPAEALNPYEQIGQDVNNLVEFGDKQLDEKVTPTFTGTPFEVNKSDTAEVKEAKETLVELIRIASLIKTGKTDLGKEIAINISDLVAAGDDPPPVIKNLKSRYGNALKTTADNLRKKIAPALRALKAAKLPADADADAEGSEDIIASDKKKADTITGDDRTTPKDWRKEKDPFSKALDLVGRK